MEQADRLIQCVERPEAAVPAITNSRRANNITRNREILKSIAWAILFCCKQCITLRGYSEQVDGDGNPGNFLALLKLVAVSDSVLY